jgi:tetratricopeptide (TPR) repeat protein
MMMTLGNRRGSTTSSLALTAALVGVVSAGGTYAGLRWLQRRTTETSTSAPPMTKVAATPVPSNQRISTEQDAGTLQAAIEARTEGNTAVQRSQFEDALQHYQRALDHLTPILLRDPSRHCTCNTPTPCLVLRAVEQRVLTLANTAFALLKLGRNLEVAAAATAALGAANQAAASCLGAADWRPSDELIAKILFRRASAYAAAGITRRAIEDLESASHLPGGQNEAVSSMLAKLRHSAS